MRRSEIIELSKNDQNPGGMFMVIPSVVMLDQELSMSAKMLYGVITWKCGEVAYCWKTNRALGEVLNLSPKRISALISDLESRGHIETEVITDPESGQVLQRNIYPIVKSSRGLTHPIPENRDTPPPGHDDTSPKKRGDPIPKNAEEKTKEDKNNNSPHSPPEGDEPAETKRRDPALPKYRPDLFARFWDKYPLREGRRSPRSKAVRAWDKLKPDMELCFAMSAALEPQNWPESWHREKGRYIPLASTWLNSIREDGLEMPARAPAVSPPPKRRAYHLEEIDGEEVVVYDD